MLTVLINLSYNTNKSIRLKIVLHHHIDAKMICVHHLQMMIFMRSSQHLKG